MGSMSYDEYIAYLKQTVEDNYLISVVESKALESVTASDEAIKTWYDTKLEEQKTKYDDDPSAYKDDMEYYNMYGGEPVLYTPKGYHRILQIYTTAKSSLGSEYTALKGEIAALLSEYGELAVADELSGEENNSERLKEIVKEYRDKKKEADDMFEEHYKDAREKIEEAYEKLEAGTPFSEVMMEYTEDVNIKNELKLRDMIQKLPKFCMDFFIGIDADKSSRTKIAYAYDLQTFFEYMKSANPSLKKYDIRDYPISLLDQISPSDIEEYLFYLKYYEKDGVVHTNDERGIKRKLASLRTFYNFYFRKEFIDTNPASKVTLPKIHEKNIIRLDTDEVAQLLDEVESGDSLSKNQQRFHEKTKVRDLALMTLLLGTGIRVSECVGLDMDDVDFKNNGIKVHRKGGADVIVYFGDEVRDALLSYWEERSIITPAEGHANALFLSLQRKRISVRSVENLVKKYSRLVTTVKNITPHKLRSTYGTTLYQETGDIYLVADVLGHKDVNTTRKHYAAQEDSRRRAAARVVHLRED